MEKTKNKKSRLGEIIIVGFVVVSTVLILAEIISNLTSELDPKDDQTLLNETLTPKEDEHPILPPEYTPELYYDG